MANKSGLERVSDLAHHLKALKDIIKAAMSGGFHAAALQAVRHYWPQILGIAAALLMLPLLLFLCLPAMLFGFGSAEGETTAAMNRQADAVQGYYGRYREYCTDRVLSIETLVMGEGGGDDTVHQRPEEGRYEVIVVGAPMETNWMIALHSVSTGNDLNAMTEQSVRDFVEKSIVYTVEEYQEPSEPETGASSNPYDDTTHEDQRPEEDDSASRPEGSETSAFILTIRYLTPEEFMEYYHYSEEDRNWAQLIYRTMTGQSVFSNG